MKIKPRILPRDILDLVIGLPVILIQLTVFIVPSIVAELVFKGIAGAVTFLVLYLIFLLFSVRSITLNENCILFNRTLGSPKCLTWDQIISIEESSRGELVLRGWLWPLFPSREMTACLSARNHFRIKWNGGFCYYPPKDIDQFKKVVSEMMEKKSNNGVVSDAAEDAAPHTP